MTEFENLHHRVLGIGHIEACDHLFDAKQAFHFLFAHLHQRNTGPFGDDDHDVFIGYDGFVFIALLTPFVQRFFQRGRTVFDDLFDRHFRERALISCFPVAHQIVLSYMTLNTVTNRSSPSVFSSVCARVGPLNFWIDVTAR